MSKVNIDTDLVRKNLLPLVNSEQSKIDTAASSASSISFPDGDLGWGSVHSELSDCSSLFKKYNEWINRVNTAYNNDIKNSVESIISLNIEDVNKREPIVK